jgi:hypothetical protein
VVRIYSSHYPPTHLIRFICRNHDGAPGLFKYWIKKQKTPEDEFGR